jgi:TRAP-type C4-dicarboxylate transport system permease small subunit
LSETSDTGHAPSNDQVGKFLHWLFGGLAALTIFGLALITFVDVVARYIFNSPIPGAYEISELVMGVMIFAALPVVTWRGSHITIDLLDAITPLWITGWRDGFMFTISSGVVAVLGWQLWALATILASYGDVTEYLRIPIHPTLQAMSLLAWITSLIALFAALVSIKRALASRNS